jgi:hypothetical protein
MTVSDLLTGANKVSHNHVANEAQKEKQTPSTYRISFLQQELSEVRAILARNTRHQGYFSFFRVRHRRYGLF